MGGAAAGASERRGRVAHKGSTGPSRYGRHRSRAWKCTWTKADDPHSPAQAHRLRVRPRTMVALEGLQRDQPDVRRSARAS
jgi:hypothetical protein